MTSTLISNSNSNSNLDILFNRLLKSWSLLLKKKTSICHENWPKRLPETLRTTSDKLSVHLRLPGCLSERNINLSMRCIFVFLFLLGTTDDIFVGGGFLQLSL